MRYDRGGSGFEARSYAMAPTAPAPKLDLVMVFAAGAIAVEFLVSGNLLMWLGVPYTADGGLLFTKLHPGSYLSVAALVARLAQGLDPVSVLRRLLRCAPGLAFYIVSISLCIVYAAAATGAGGLVTLLDSFLPAGCLAAALADASAVQLRALGGLVMMLLMMNAVVGIAEAGVGAHFVPLAGNILELASEFRPTGLYDHPLTAAMATMMGVLLDCGGRFRAAGRVFYLATLTLFLFACGGRVALALAILAALVLAGRRAVRSVLRRNISIPILCAASAALVALSVASAAAVEAGLGARLIGHLYWDPSAQSRIGEFTVLQRLDTTQILFGARRADLIAMIEPLRLSIRVDVIENFWLLMFCTLGAVCFPVFVVGFMAFLMFLFRSGDVRARLIVVAFLLAASCSNSLGRKSTLLVMLVGCVAVSGGGWRAGRAARPGSSAPCMAPALA